MNARSITRSIAQLDASEQCTYVRTDERTDVDVFSPTRDTSSSVTRTPTYGFSPETNQKPNRYARPRTARTPQVVAAIHELIEDGLSDRAIGKRLSIGARTVARERTDTGAPPVAVDDYIDEMAVTRAVDGYDAPTLTPAETTQAVRILTARGRSARLIADQLGITTRTVTRHRTKSNQENAA